MLDRLLQWVEDNKIFERERKSNEQRVLGMLLYHAGLSYEKAGFFVNASYEAVREWYQKGKVLFELSIEKKRRKRIAIDEKELNVNGIKIYIWGAIDLDGEKAIAVMVSFGRCYLETMMFLNKVLRACKGKLPVVFIDGGKWYPWALKRLGFHRFFVVHFGPRSAIERFFGEIEWRIRKFWNGYRGGFSKDSMERWMIAFSGFRNYVKDFGWRLLS